MGALTGLSGLSGLSGIAGAVWTPVDIAGVEVVFDDNYGCYSDAGMTPCEDTDPVYRQYAIYPAGDTIYREQTDLNYRPIFNLGANGKAYLDYDGSDDHLILANFAGITFAENAARTYAQHVLIDVANVWSMFTSRTGNNELRLNSNTGCIQLNIATVGIVTEPSAHATGVWTNIIGTYSGAEGGELFIDGASVGTAADPGFDVISGDVHYGQQEGGNFRFNGRETMAVICSAIMTPTEVANFKAYCEANEPT